MEDLKFIQKQEESLFTKKKSLDSLWQEIAEQFYPERAEFTAKRYLGEEFAANLMTGYPVMARRDLGDAFSSMLRRQQTWFDLRLEREEHETTEVRQALEWLTGLMRRAMYDRRARFERAVKEGDQDFAAFGQCALSVEINRRESRLLYRSWHLRDCAWGETDIGDIYPFFRRWKPTARDLKARFGKVHEKVERCLAKDPLKEIDCAHGVMEGERKKFRSVFYDRENKFVLEDVETDRFPYVVPRWSTVSGSQYAYSPAVVVALPDARLIQAITLTLLEAGEKYVNPPMLATQEAIRSDVNVMAGGITWVDAKYDERLGEVLRPLSQDKSGFPAIFSIADGVKESIANAFYLNKLNLPVAGEMTAYEVSQRIQEYIRQALPLFQPMEQEYNGALCDSTLELLMEQPSIRGNLPEVLLGQEVRFQFDSPLREAEDREQVVKFQEMLANMETGAAFDPMLLKHIDLHQAFRGAVEAIAPADWMVSEDTAQKRIQVASQEQAEQQAMAMAAEAAGG